MFIFCKVRTLRFAILDYGFVDADGNILKTIQKRIDIEGAIRP